MTNEQIKTFLTAGRAVFTLKSRKSGQHFTYKITKKEAANVVYFVSVLRGSDEWTYMGMLMTNPRYPVRVMKTQNSKVDLEAPSFKAINWYLRNLEHDQIEFKHEGKCCRCGRALTHPDSIDSGIGPECANKLGVSREPTRGPANCPVQHLAPMPEAPPRPLGLTAALELSIEGVRAARTSSSHPNESNVAKKTEAMPGTYGQYDVNGQCLSAPLGES